MAYQSDQIIEANGTLLDDYNELAALINEIYGDTHSGDHAFATGSFGYGQSPEISNVAIGDIITAAQWTSLFGILHKCANHQGTTIGGLVSSVSIGDLIDAFDSPDLLTDLITNVRANKLNIDPGESAITLNGTQQQQVNATPWTTAVVHEFDVTFADGDAARHFFNSGGEIHWSGSYVPGTPDESSEETQWQTVFNDIATVSFNHSTTTSGSGAAATLGYFDLTTTYQQILLKSIGTGAGYYYATESVSIDVKATNSNLNVLRFRVTFNTDPSPDRILNGTLTSNVDQKKSVGNIVALQPSYSLVSFTVDGA